MDKQCTHSYLWGQGRGWPKDIPLLAAIFTVSKAWRQGTSVRVGSQMEAVIGCVMALNHALPCSFNGYAYHNDKCTRSRYHHSRATQEVTTYIILLLLEEFSSQPTFAISLDSKLNLAGKSIMDGAVYLVHIR